jgi:hypothetical protein
LRSESLPEIGGDLQRIVTYLWKQPLAARPYRSAVSLHGHTNHSKEGLYFIAEFAAKHTLLRRALAGQEHRAMSKSAIRIDFWKAYWTPPLPPLAAWQLERDQIESKLGLRSMVSLSDHDSIEAPMLLRVVPEARRIPVSLEWTVPFRDTTLHLGLHNLPSGQAESIVRDLREHTRSSIRDPDENHLADLLSMLDQHREVLVVLNHPMWDLAGIGKQRHVSTLNAFVAKYGMFLHAFELGGLRGWEENQATVDFAEGWNTPIIGGGDRHGCEPSAVLNLSEAENFSEFIHEVRRKGRTHVLFMPQYAEPLTLRILQTLLDVIRHYPDFPAGSRRWDERVFHPDANGVVRPLSALWRKPAGFIEGMFSVFRLLEVHPVRSAMHFVLAKPSDEMTFDLGDGQEVVP